MTARLDLAHRSDKMSATEAIMAFSTWTRRDWCWNVGVFLVATLVIGLISDKWLFAVIYSGFICFLAFLKRSELAPRL